MIRNWYSKQQVTEAIERNSPSETDSIVPTFMCTWWGDGLRAKYGDTLDRLNTEYPNDIIEAFYICPGETDSPLPHNPEYRWGFKDYSGKARHSIGKACVLLEDWDELDDFETHMPSADEQGIFDGVQEKVRIAHSGNPESHRYVLGCFWRLFHERFWAIRGMENLMYDYYDSMDGLKRLGRILLEYYKRVVDRFAECGVDGIFTSDDLGHQTGSMMSPSVFRELYLPLYKEFVAYVHNKSMHVFLHSCGNNAPLMDMLIESGIDVFHPIQAGCMDIAETAAAYGERISFLWGVDVQHLLPEGSPESVQGALLRDAALLYKKKGGLLIAAGNGIMPDTPYENIEAMLRTVHRPDIGCTK